jgi:hypothetical protein
VPGGLISFHYDLVARRPGEDALRRKLVRRQVPEQQAGVLVLANLPQRSTQGLGMANVPLVDSKRGYPGGVFRFRSRLIVQ